MKACKFAEFRETVKRELASGSNPRLIFGTYSGALIWDGGKLALFHSATHDKSLTQRQRFTAAFNQVTEVVR